ncbi:hypothetical protein B2D07_17475 [Desulfococcus multivorans]|nr:hypothetical protein B2D07_17475 [Desulfococcus multivorans]
MWFYPEKKNRFPIPRRRKIYKEKNGFRLQRGRPETGCRPVSDKKLSGTARTSFVAAGVIRTGFAPQRAIR